MDPLRLVQKIPAGLQIPDLRDRLVHIIADFRTQTSLREGCNNILHHDCLVLAQVILADLPYAAGTSPKDAIHRSIGLQDGARLQSDGIHIMSSPAWGCYTVAA